MDWEFRIKNSEEIVSMIKVKLEDLYGEPISMTFWGSLADNLDAINKKGEHQDKLIFFNKCKIHRY